MLPKKLLHLASDSYKGGAESVFRNTIEQTLSSKRFEVFVASCDTKPPVESSHFLKLDDWEDYPKWRGVFKYIFNITNYMRLKRFLFAIKPDIIHTQNYLSRLSPSVLFALRLYKRYYPHTKLVCTLHCYEVCANACLYNYAKKQICQECIGASKYRIAWKNCDRRGWIYSLLKAIRVPFYQGFLLDTKQLFDTAIFVGDFQASKYIQDGWDTSKIEIITNPIELRFYNPHIKLEDKENLIVYFGRLSAEKNIPLLIHTFGILIRKPEFANYKLCIIGDGEERGECEYLAKEHIGRNYAFLGRLQPNEIRAILRTTKLTLSPSLLYETFGLTIVESILAGSIPITSKLGAMYETTKKYFGLSFAYSDDFLQNCYNLESVIIEVLSQYEQYFEIMLQRRDKIMRDLENNSYLKSLIRVYEMGGGLSY